MGWNFNLILCTAWSVFKDVQAGQNQTRLFTFISISATILLSSRRTSKDWSDCAYHGSHRSSFYIWAWARQHKQNDMCDQRSLRAVWASAQSNQSSLCAVWVANDLNFHQSDSKDYGQIGRIWDFAGRTGHLFVLLCCGLLKQPRYSWLQAHRICCFWIPLFWMNTL